MKHNTGLKCFDSSNEIRVDELLDPWRQIAYLGRSRGIFRTMSSIYDGVFLWKYLMTETCYFEKA